MLNGFYVMSQKSLQEHNNIDDDFVFAKLGKFADIYRSNKILDVNVAWQKIKTNKLEQLPSNSFFPGLADKYYWLVIKLNNTSKINKKLIIEINNPQIDTIYFYEVLKNDSIVLLGESGDEIPFSKRLDANELPVFPININPKKEKTYILMLRKRKIIKFPSKIYDVKEFQHHSRNKMFFYSLYFGGVFLIFTFSIIIGIFIRNKILIAYGIYVILIASYIFTETGFAYEFIYPNIIWLNSPIRVPISLFAMIAFLYFSNLFIDTKQHSRLFSKLFYMFYIAWIATYLISLPFVMFYPSQYHSFILKAHYIFILLGLILMIITLVVVYKHNKKICQTYLFAISIFILGAAIYLVPEFGITKFGITDYHPMFLASIGEFFVFSIAIFLNIINIFKEKNRLTELTAKQEKDILTAQIDGREEANKRISSELHDNISSRLALIKNIVLTGNKSKTEISKDISEIYKEVRDLSHRLSPNNFFILGCSTSVKKYLKEINDNTKLTIKTEFYCDINNDLDNEIGLQVFRIIQEALQNCIKHAGEAEVKVQIIMHDNELSLIIEDDGKGFDTQDNLFIDGTGIKNIAMRVKLLNGIFDLTSKIGVGTFIDISIPFDKNIK